MIIHEWPQINDKFYAFNSKPKENTTVTEFMSGRRIGNQINSRNIMTINCSIRFTKEELNTFWNWFNDELGQLSGVFSCAALGNKNYQFVEIPEPQDTDQMFRKLSLVIEEVY